MDCLDREKETTQTVSSFLVLIGYWLGSRPWEASGNKSEACANAALDFRTTFTLFWFPPQSAEGRTRTWYGPRRSLLLHCSPLASHLVVEGVAALALARADHCACYLQCAMAAYALYHHGDALPEQRDSRLMGCLVVCFLIDFQGNRWASPMWH